MCIVYSVCYFEKAEIELAEVLLLYANFIPIPVAVHGDKVLQRRICKSIN